MMLHIPSELIAQTPASPRDSSRLMTIDRKTGTLGHYHFYDLPKLLNPSDVLVFNNSKVIPARLIGKKTTGGRVEILLLRKQDKDLWEVISHPGLKPGQIINFTPKTSALVISANIIKLKYSESFGHTPLPPYIHSSSPEALLRKQYQTIYAKTPGSAAAPTAGLHFTKRLITSLPQQKEYLTLHVGLGTFKPPTPEQISSGHLHTEYFELSPDTASRLKAAKDSGRRIIAVGTTTTRVLESTGLVPQTGDTDIFIKSLYRFKVVDGMITNFHLPESSLLMLVSAFSSPEIIRHTYSEAIRLKYRFFSFGDACLII
jgi:S-adenosylmethionine:tRNA ribosyltransferase-isomerase